MSKFFNEIAWIITILLQIIVGLVAGYIMFAEGYGSVIYMWLGVTLGVFLIGVLAILFRPAIAPKDYVLRLGLVAAGVALPLVIFYYSPLFFYNADYETPPEFPLLATVMGVVCFYSLGRITPYLKTARMAGYGSFVFMLCVGLYVFWDWYTPRPLPIRRLEPYESLNMKLENIIGDRFRPEVIRAGYVYGVSNRRLVVLDISDPENTSVVGRSAIIPGDVFRINLYENYAYLTSGAFGDEEENKIYVVDISNPMRPEYLNSYDLSGKYIWDVKTLGDYLYIVGCVQCTQAQWDQHALYIMDLANPVVPREVGRYYSDINIVDVNAFGNYAYLALDEEGISHSGMRVLDVSDPKQPEKVEDLFPSATGVSVTVSDNTLYFNGGAQELNGLHIMDISNPQKLTEIAFYPDYATIFSGSNGYIVNQGDATDRTPCGCTTTSLDDLPKTEELTFVDYSDPLKPQQMGTFEYEEYSISIHGDTGFHWDFKTQTYNFLDFSDPRKPVELGSYFSGALFDLTGEIFVDGDYGVLPTEETDLYIFDFSDPVEPVLSNVYEIGDYYWMEALDKNHVYLYVNGEIQVLDISNPKEPAIVWRYETSGHFPGISIQGTYAYLADDVDGLFVYNISNPAQPVLINHQPDLNGFRYIDDFDPSGRYFFVFDMDKIRVFDAADPLKVEDLGSVRQAGYDENAIVDGLAFLDNSIFSGGKPAEALLLDVSDPRKIDRLASFGWPYYSKVAGVSKEEVFIASFMDGLHVMDFSNPKRPRELGFYEMEDGASGLAIGVDNIVYVISENDDLYVIRYLP